MALSSDIGILILLFLLSGFFSSAEAALLSLTDLHLHKMKSDNYPFFDFVVKLLENPRRLLITIVTGNEAVNISISILAAALFISLFGAKGQWISIVVTSVVLFLAGEAIPKTFGVTYPMRISSVVAPLLLVYFSPGISGCCRFGKNPRFVIEPSGQEQDKRFGCPDGR